MNYRDFKAAVALDANEPRDYEQIVFRTPDGTNYHNVTIDFGYWNNSKDKAIIVNLFNIKPKFKVGDVVTNNGGLHPNVKCTIAVVNEELEYYGYKEVNGRTYFKDQDELKLVEIEPKFKVGDRVKFVSTMVPEKEYVINSVNKENQCYTYFNGGRITPFKDQNKLVLVESDNSKLPVEECISINAKELKTIQIKALENKIGSDIIKNVVDDMKDSANTGSYGVLFSYEKYKITNDKIYDFKQWINLCGLTISTYDDKLCIRWD